MVVLYLGPNSLALMICLRSSAVAGPRREEGGRIRVWSTIDGMPLASRVDTRASPIPSSVMTFSVSRFGFCRKVEAAERTAFWSRGVKARSEERRVGKEGDGGLAAFPARLQGRKVA